MGSSNVVFPTMVLLWVKDQIMITLETLEVL